MKEIFLGEFIKQRRLELGLTQEQLCEGICEPMTISRIENGRQPHHAIALMHCSSVWACLMTDIMHC